MIPQGQGGAADETTVTSAVSNVSEATTAASPPPISTANTVTTVGPDAELLVQYLTERFPSRFVILKHVAGNINCYGTAYNHLLHYKVIKGTLRDLGIGSEKNERHERTVRFRDEVLTFEVMDVVCALRSTRSSFEAWRKDLRAASATRVWMTNNRHLWDVPTEQGDQWRELWEGLAAMFGADVLPPRMSVDEEEERSVVGVNARDVMPEASDTVSPGVQRARGWSNNALRAQLKGLWKAFGMTRKQLPPWDEMVD